MQFQNDNTITPEIQEEIMLFVKQCREKEPLIKFSVLKRKVKKKFKVILYN